MASKGKLGFSYDANGNQLSGLGRTLTWTAFNMPATIAQGAAMLSFAYDPEHARVKKTGPSGTTLYLNAFGMMAERLAGAGGTVQITEYVVAGDDTVAVRTARSNGSVSLRWLHKDHIGSVVALTDETGAVAERLSYDSWGKRRNPNGGDDPAGALTSQASRGFTGHEMLDDVDLVHMNGRVYDPITARFASADPLTDRKFGSQGWNRYSYVGNNPLIRTDPSGYSWLSKTVGHFLGPVAGLSFIPAVHRLEQRVFSNQIAASALMVSSAGCLQFAAACAAGNAAYLSSLQGGSLMDMGKAAAISYATAMAFQAVGNATNGHYNATTGKFGNVAPADYFGSADHFANIAGHAAVGCASTAASGGSCGSGALSAGFGSLAAPKVAPLGFVRGLTATMVVGGTGSVLGGGKFGNGATTAAFGYLFNSAMDGFLLDAFCGGSGCHFSSSTGRALSEGPLLNESADPPEYKTPVSGSGKEKASDVPSWAQGEKPYVGESGKGFADRLLGDKYGEGNYGKGPGSEFNKIKKWGDRGFK